ncbi:hypothetical protein A2U01_0100744, partial [Trifolium medium]|nr:hypothetical protein [Trifolium medium]
SLAGGSSRQRLLSSVVPLVGVSSLVTELHRCHYRASPPYLRFAFSVGSGFVCSVYYS